MKHFVVIVAGGQGKRMGSSVPKQFLLLHNKPILMHTIERFKVYDPSMEVILVLPKDQVEHWNALCAEYGFQTDHKVVLGGDTRFQSVKNGLEMVGPNSIVAIHDGVRPLVSTQTIKRTFIEAATYGSAIPVTDSTQSVRFIEENGLSRALNRSQVVLVQTPQTFKSDLIKAAYDQPFQQSFTDDASVAEAAGARMHLTHGNIENVKITTKDDLLYAESVMVNKLVE